MTLTHSQLDILRHSLGIRYVGAVTVAFEYTRNHYCCEVGSEDETEIKALIEAGYMRRGKTINDGRDFYAHVTDKGLEAVIDAAAGVMRKRHVTLNKEPLRRYRITAAVTGSKYCGEVEARTREEAIEIAEKELDYSPSLCHQCAEECEDAMIDELFAEEI